MVRPPLLPLLLLPLLGLVSCTCPTEARLLVERPDFRSPEGTGRSFLAAVSRDDAPAEYRCLSEALKEESGATLDAWMIGRVEARREIGPFLLNRAHRLDYLGTVATEQGLLTRWGFGETPRLGLLMVPQHYFDLHGPDGPITGELLDQPPEHYLDADGRALRLEILDALPRRFRGFSETTRFELGTEWKLRSLRVFDS